MPELKTKVKYNDLDGTRNVVTIQGVSFKPDESLELTDFLPEPQAKKLAEKLSTNPYFDVAGGEDKTADREEREANLAKREQELQDIRQKQYLATMKQAADEGTPVPPADVSMPETLQLAENPQARKGNRTPPAR